MVETILSIINHFYSAKSNNKPNYPLISFCSHFLDHFKVAVFILYDSLLMSIFASLAHEVSEKKVLYLHDQRLMNTNCLIETTNCPDSAVNCLPLASYRRVLIKMAVIYNPLVVPMYSYFTVSLINRTVVFKTE